MTTSLTDTEVAEPVQRDQGRPAFSFVVPCYNEAPNLAATVAEIETSARDSGLASFEIVMVDDGSSMGRPTPFARSRIPSPMCGQSSTRATSASAAPTRRA